ncbi:P-loop containing nucleoside triphosphate hydrolase protein [Lactarius hatsudake]|nr:P-loop containing nucleoside triphosphate hydrolase protein [Lactarius hatsudake]
MWIDNALSYMMSQRAGSLKRNDVFGYSEYKGKQKEIFEAAINGADVLAVAPAGMDKSGITIVISPLLEIARLRRHKVHVASLTSETSKSEKREKLCSAEFMKLLAPLYQRGELNRLVVDETIRERFPDVPLMALTASATPLVQGDTARILRMAAHRLSKFVHPFNRPHLFYDVRYHSSEAITQMDEVLNYIWDLHRRLGRPSSGIIYCRTRMTCDDLSNYLRGKGLNCRPYHRGIKCGWEEGGDGTRGIDVCAMIAFGMGIDKSDVRYFIHYDLPKSFEGYYQETGKWHSVENVPRLSLTPSGRAGRDGEVRFTKPMSLKEAATEAN